MNSQQATPVGTLDRDEGHRPDALPPACADGTSGSGTVGSGTVSDTGSASGNAPSSRAGRSSGTGRSSGRPPFTTLDRLRAGEECRVVGLRLPGESNGARAGSHAVAQRLSELGFVEGTRLRVVRFAPLGDPMEVEVRGYHLSLRRTEAALVEVEREPSLRAACSPD